MKTYKIDQSHSEITFKVKHMMITTVTGMFTAFDAEMTSDKEDFSDANIHFEADISSITTNNQQRDEHLKSEDFFAAEQFPKMTFKSTALKKVDDEEFMLDGELTIRGITKAVTLKGEYGGSMLDPYGNTRIGFALAGKISRKEFNLSWNAMTEAGGIIVSDEVKLIVNVQMLKAQPEA